MTPNSVAAGPPDNRGTPSAVPQRVQDDVITPAHDLFSDRIDQRSSEKQKEGSGDTDLGQHNARKRGGLQGHFSKQGKLRPFRLLKEDFGNFKFRYFSDWTVFNQLVLASAIYVFFTNILPGITFASDLYVLTGESWGTIEVVFSTGLCGIIFAL